MTPEEYVSNDGLYVIPVSWEVYANITIDGAKNLEDAYRIAQEYIDDLPLATDPAYIEGSYRLEVQNDDELLDAQDYYRYDAYFKNPEV